MTGEALAGWVLGVLDASGDSPTPAQIRVIRIRLRETLGMKELDGPEPAAKVAKAKPITRADVLRVAKGPRGGQPPEVPDDLPTVELDE